MTPYWRWVIQSMLCAGIASLLVVIPAVNTLLEGTGYWAAGAAVAALDVTAGGSLRCLIDRSLGTLLGGFLAWSLFTAITVNGRYTQELWCRLTLIVVCFLWAYPWGLVRQCNPRHPLVSLLGTYTGYLVIATAYAKGGAFKTAALRTACIFSGVTVTGVVAMFVIPRRARDEVRRGLADTLSKVGEMLDAVIDLAAGLQPEGAAECFNPVRHTVATVAAKKLKLQTQLETFRAMRTARLVKKRTQQQQTATAAKARNGINQTHAVSPCATAESASPDIGQQDFSEGIARRFLDGAAGATLRLSRKISMTFGFPASVRGTEANVKDLNSSCSGFVSPSDDHDIDGILEQQQRLSYDGLIQSHISSDVLQVLSFKDARRFDEGLTKQVTTASPHPQKDSFAVGAEGSALQTDSSAFSAGSRATLLFREADEQLEKKRQSAILELASAMRVLLDEEEGRRKEEWNISMQRFEDCAVLLASQNDLLRAAKREVSFCDSTGVIFPYKRYLAAILQVQTLFNHIAALFFALTSQVAQIATARRSSLMALPRTDTPDWETARNSEDLQMLFAGVAAAYRHTEAFGTILSVIVRHFREALLHAAEVVHKRIFTNKAVDAIDAAASGIDVLLALRNQRRRLWAQIFSQRMEGVENSREPAEAWESLLGLDSTTFQSMAPMEQKAFWNTYWRSRDKLSVVVNSLLLLRDNLYVLCDTIDAIVGQQMGDQRI